MLSLVVQTSLLLTVLFCIGIALFTFKSTSPNRAMAYVWILMNAMVAIWAACWWAGGFYFASARLRWTFMYISNVDAVWLPLLFVVFVRAYLGKGIIIQPVRWAIIGSGLLFCGMLLYPFELMPSLQRVQISYLPIGGWLMWVFVGQYVLLTVAGCATLLFSLRGQSPLQRRKTQYILVGCFIGFLSGFTTFPPSLGISKQYPYGLMFMPLYSLIITYAIFKHNLIDITIIVRKTAVYSAVSAILIAVYVGIISVLSRALVGYFPHVSVFSSAIAAATIALLFHPLQIHIQHWLDRRFPRESLNQALLREATSEFVHEIKRPLANISMPAQLALMDLQRSIANQAHWEDMVPKLQQRLEYILHESIEAGDTIEAIRALSSQAPRSHQPVELEKLLKEILEREHARIMKGKIQVALNIEHPALAIDGDAKQLEIALANVLKNAVDALTGMDGSKPRNLQLTVRTEANYVLIDIEDSGPGIAKTDLAKLFDPWFSTKGSLGMGIGLFLTHEILRRHGASIEAQSEEGVGTRFRIIFSANKK